MKLTILPPGGDNIKLVGKKIKWGRREGEGKRENRKGKGEWKGTEKGRREKERVKGGKT